MYERWTGDPSSDRPRRARVLFERFHRFPADRLVSMACAREIPPVLVHLGWLEGLIYRSDRGNPGTPRRFIHFFEVPARLACDAQGRQLYVIGGRYRVTERGIEG